MISYGEIEDETRMARFLKSSKPDDGIDYTVLSIAVQTLALILFVEIVKHKLDHFAHGRPFFKTVLHSMYNELSTLGIVELVVYLTLKYLKDYDQAKKSVFADVHFALFYIAVFNAFQTVIVAVATKRTSNVQWVETEHLELDHYVEIREEFERVKQKLGYDEDELVDPPSIGSFFRGIRHIFQNPGLQSHYSDLLVQVNFHSLRLHFLHSNDLPLTLKVSDYLKRSEERVLEKLVHVSGGAWLMLTGCLSLVYFLMGMVAYVSEDQEVVGLFLKGIFFSMLLIFILISIAVYFKMRSTFHSIITAKYKMKKIDDETREAGMKSQKELFWLGEPQFVISMVQFMQFGYALALAVVLMYWTSLTTFEPYYFLVSVILCYSVFVFILSRTLPQYTLCTSLGYLIDEANLLETVAFNRLEEARRVRIQSMVESNFEDDSIVSFESSETSRIRDSSMSDDSSRLLPARNPDRNSILAALVQSDTESLRTLLPDSVRRSMRDRDSRRNGQRKSLSDGVGSMRLSFITKRDASVHSLGSQLSSEQSETEIHQTVDDSAIVKQHRVEKAKRRRAKKRSMSAGGVIQSWQRITKQELELDGDNLPKQLSTISDSGLVPVDDRKGSSTLSRDEKSSVCQVLPANKVLLEGRLGTKVVHGAIGETTNEMHSTAKTVVSDFRDETCLALGTKSDNSVGDLSDVDVQNHSASIHDPTVVKKYHDGSYSRISTYARNYFLGSRFHTFSHVFGSLVAFFLVGHRVEVMLTTTGAIEPSENTWELDLGISFWLQAVWYSFFVLASIFVLALFLPIKVKSKPEKAIIAACILDFLLSGACLMILFLAEAQRCCDKDEFDVQVDCCPFWGSRTHGGLGDIEPFTALIGLRVFRFVAARYLVENFEDANPGPGDTMNSELQKHDDSTQHRHGSSMQSQVGTPLELWEKAITKYPGIVEKYGQFSTELLQAMLGLEVLEERSSNAGNETKTTQRRSIRLIGSEYDALPTATQSIILAGKLGKPVKTLPNLLGQASDLPALAEETDHDELTVDRTMKSHPAAFEIDNERLAMEKVVQSTFVAPNARLIRSMRRCDRKMLPILTEWGCVDVVITQFEMVYFESFDPLAVDSKSHEDECSLLALQATGGGKGLRLRDVAKGRKIVGHMNLLEVIEIHVERNMPLSDGVQKEDISRLYDKDDKLPTEFWCRNEDEQKPIGCRKSRWEKVKEDRLRLITAHGCLVLRFFSDLEDAETNAGSNCREDGLDGPLRKNVALQWAQTVAHICGKEKLKQALPHFGENNSDELRDLLEFANNHEKEHSALVKNLKENFVVASTSFGPSSRPRALRRQSLDLSSSIGGRIRRRLSLSSHKTASALQPEDGVVEELDNPVE